jgi:hypothetical protein
MPDLNSDIVGRVGRLSLPRTERGALTPLMEAISNSIHSITDRFDDSAHKNGSITIRVLRDLDDEDTPIIGFEIIDNGEGFTDENYQSFCTPDSRLKEVKGGKGIGRLGWLKVFEHISVDSTFLSADGTLRRRGFLFRLSSREQIKEADAFAPDSSPRTTVTFKNFRPHYAGRVSSNPETLQSRIASHFVPLFLAGNAPQIIIDDGPLINVETIFSEHIVDQKTETISILLDDELCEFEVWSLKCDKSVRFDARGVNFVVLAGHKRSVEEFSIDTPLGLRWLDDGENFYIACVNSPYLDEHVNAERTQYTFDAEHNERIRREVIGVARNFLAKYIEQMLMEKQRLANEIIQENPQFLYAVTDVHAFVVELPANLNTREEIFVEMSRKRFRRQRHFDSIKRSLDSPLIAEAVQQKVDEYFVYVTEEKKGALAEYVIRRKAILDIFEKLLGYQDYDKVTYSREDAIHNLICPMKTDSHNIQFDDHNLWMIDDRLPFFKFFASDLELRKYSEAASNDRPDLAFFFDACFAWREGENTDTVVIVEFKKPMRVSYSQGRDPVSQVLHYVEQLKKGAILTPSGRPVQGITSGTAFHCYIIADVTPQLRETFIGRFERTPDGQGYFGYTREPDAFVEVIPFNKVLANARMRNVGFFKELGITPID